MFESFLASRSRVGGGGLSDEQRGVVEARWRMCRHRVIQACPGAGKTHVLVLRVLKGIESGIAGKEVVLLTYTRQAALEFKKRLEVQGGKLAAGRRKEVGDVVCATVHSLAWRLYGLLKEKGVLEAGGLLLGEEECKTVLAGVLERGGWHAESDVEGGKEDMEVGEVWRELSRRRENRELGDYGWIAAGYLQAMREGGWLDFTNILEDVLEVMRGDAKVRELVGRVFFFVDEFQDLSCLQVEVLKELGGVGGFYEWYGDVNQAIYGFKGSTGDVLSQVRGVIGGEMELHRLTKSYRCGDVILKRAQGLVGEVGLVGVEGGVVEVEVYVDLGVEIEAAAKWVLGGSGRVVLVRTRKVLERVKEVVVGLSRKPEGELRELVKTVHESKGLEWDEVRLLHMVEGYMPHALGDVAEEGRLAYVGVTRARKRVVLSVGQWVEATGKALEERELTGAGGLLRSRWVRVMEGVGGSGGGVALEDDVPLEDDLPLE